MTEEVFYKYAMSLGFPTLVAAFVLIRLENVLKDVRDGVRDLLQHVKDKGTDIIE